MLEWSQHCELGLVAKGGELSARGWVASWGELGRLKLLNLLGDEGHLEQSDPRAYAAVGGDDSELSLAWRDLERRGLIEEEDQMPALGRVYRLSAGGLAAYRIRVAKVHDQGAVRWSVRGAILDWLMCADSDEFQDLEAFLGDPRAVIEGIRPAQRSEVMSAAVYLKERGLIEVMGVEEIPVVKLRITADGQDVVDHFAGDVSAWVRRHDGGGGLRVDTGGGDFISNSERVQTMRNSPGARQAQGGSSITAAEADEISVLLDGLRALIANTDLPAERRAELDQLTQDVDLAVNADDRPAVRRAWSRAKSALQATGPTLAYFTTKMILPAVFDEPPADGG